MTTPTPFVPPESKDELYYHHILLDELSEEETIRARVVARCLPILRASAEKADKDGSFCVDNIAKLRETGVMGLVVPKEYGGLGGSLRDLCACVFAFGAIDASTALSFFFHCSSSSRGLLGFEAIDAGLFTDEGEKRKVKEFATRLLRQMGEDGLWTANFASEQNKSATAGISITTEAKKVDGGYLLNGVKSFGSGTGIADKYLVTAKLEGTTTAAGLCVFIVDPKAKGCSNRHRWDALGMRSSETHGIILENVFVSEEDSLAIQGAFVKMMQMSKGSFVGNQVCVAAAYAGGAQGVFDFAMHHLTTTTFADAGKPIAESPFHQELIGKMAVDLETALLWTRRQIVLETTGVPHMSKDRVIAQWRLCKGEATEAAYRVCTSALKACGTSNTSFSGPISRSLRDCAMGLVQAFPAERGRLEAAQMISTGRATAQFGVLPSNKK